MRVLAAALLAAAAMQPALGQAGAGVDMEYYDVSAPSGRIGKAIWNLSYKYTTRAPREGGCAVEQMSTDLTLRIRLPRWNPQPGASAGLVSHWQAYVAALEVHEHGHLQKRCCSRRASATSTTTRRRATAPRRAPFSDPVRHSPDPSFA